MSREYCREVDKSFRRSIATVESDLEKWYNRLAVNNEVSLLRAKQMLNDKELQEFKWTVEEYVKYGEKNSITQEWLKELENASSKTHIERLESIKMQLQNQVEVAYGNLEDGLSTTLSKIYENSYYKTGYEIQKGLNVGRNLTAIDNGKIDKAIKRPWATDNNNFSSRIWKNKQQLINNLNTNLTQSIIRGEDPQRAINNISKIMNTSKTNVGRLVMTESAFISSSAQKDCFNELDVEQYEIVATLDTKTSEICRELDGEVFDMKDYQPGVTAPPFHCWCRTTTCPYFDDEFTQGEERAYRDADGKTQYVKDMTYDDWYDRYVTKSTENEYNKLKGITTSDGIKVSGNSIHLIDRAIEREVDAESSKEALINPLRIGKIKTDSNGNKSIEYTGKQARVIINPDTGNIITVWKTSEKLRNRLMKGVK